MPHLILGAIAMNDVKEHVNQDTQEASENDGPEDFFIDILLTSFAILIIWCNH